VTHADLFLENSVKLPFLNVDLPLLAFFFLAPILFLIVHAYTLVHLVMLTEKAKRYHQALHDPERNVADASRENLQWQLPSNIFIQFLAGPSILRDGPFGRLLRTIAWVTLVIAPVLLLLMMQIQFLPFHSSFITWTHRAALLVDLVLVWWLWGRILSGREVDSGRQVSWGWAALGLVCSLAVVLFSGAAATFPSEWHKDLLAKWDKTGISSAVHYQLFASEVDKTSGHRWLPLSSTLVLSGFVLYEGLGIDDPKKTEWREYVFRARGRDLKGAIFDLASLPKVDFTGAQLQGASLILAQLQGARLDGAHLEDANLGGAKLQGAFLFDAELQGALLNGAKRQGASLGGAHLEGAKLTAGLQGASFDRAHLEGASLFGAELQGASLSGAYLTAASLIYANLQGATLDHAHLEGASLEDAQLQGALLQAAELDATDLSDAELWRTNRRAQTRRKISATIRLSDETDAWLPQWTDSKGEAHPWDDKAYRELLQTIDPIQPGRLRDEALERVRRLDCNNADKSLASCDPSVAPPDAADAWRSFLENARASDEAYAKALVPVLKEVVCSSDDQALYVLRGLLRFDVSSEPSRLAAAGPEAPALVDFIMSKDCPVSASLTDADMADLLRIKQETIKKPGG
jgi:uncharacterized protein YjbI with pentapeptide repeats